MHSTPNPFAMLKVSGQIPIQWQFEVEISRRIIVTSEHLR